jgi:SAM-dependent methyltransferase
MYETFSQFYDLLVDLDYDQYVEIIRQHIPKGTRVIDLACGTGQVIHLLKDEYQFVGADVSEDMLELAAHKNPEIDFFVHDLRDPFFVEQIQAAICTVDSFNYLTEHADLEQAIQNISASLPGGGQFIFDVITEERLAELDDYLFVSDIEAGTLIWSANVEEDEVEHELIMYVQGDDGLYERFEEHHTQKVFAEEWIDDLLEPEFEFKKVHWQSRIIYVCNKRVK